MIITFNISWKNRILWLVAIAALAISIVCAGMLWRVERLLERDVAAFWNGYQLSVFNVNAVAEDQKLLVFVAEVPKADGVA